MKKISLLILAGVFALTSCVTVKKLPGLDKVYVTNTKQINILPPSEVDVQLDDLMQLNLKNGGSSVAVLVYVQSDSDGVFIDIMNDFGTDMGTMTYDGESVELDCPLFPKNMPPEYIINDLQNAFYKFDSVKNNLNQSKLEFTETVDSKTKTVVRTVKDGEKVIEKVTISGKSVTVENLLRKYSFSLIVSE